MSNQRFLRPGVSGIALDLPELRVDLERWCAWVGASWGKVESVVGRSFRIPRACENVYTMAANAALKLILSHDINPEEVGFLALGTESATDTSAGAVIVRGMLDQALLAVGLPPLSPRCEVPEVKHACLGGIYALKQAVRYLAYDGRGRKAIVLCADVAEYERGSSGEQTQGAGAVALLLEADPKLFEVDLEHAGSASRYRGPDFRKPVRRFMFADYPSAGRRHDFPVFNGRYSTYCYLDQTLRATADMVHRLASPAMEVFEGARALFFHRPYHHMPLQAAAALYIQALAETAHGRAELTTFCDHVGVTMRDVLRDLEPTIMPRTTRFDVAQISVDPRPHLTTLARVVRKSDAFRAFVQRKLGLGSERMRELGNLYTAALPAWLAAGFEQALEEDLALSGETLIAIGYGSGDAAEALPLRVVDGWQEAAKRIGFRRALQGAVDLDQAQYEALHDGVEGGEALPASAPGRFVIDMVGATHSPEFQDIGLEYYRRA